MACACAVYIRESWSRVINGANRSLPVYHSSSITGPHLARPADTGTWKASLAVSSATPATRQHTHREEGMVEALSRSSEEAFAVATTSGRVDRERISRVQSTRCYTTRLHSSKLSQTQTKGGKMTTSPSFGLCPGTLLVMMLVAHTSLLLRMRKAEEHQAPPTTHCDNSEPRGRAFRVLN